MSTGGFEQAELSPCRVKYGEKYTYRVCHLLLELIFDDLNFQRSIACSVLPQPQTMEFQQKQLGKMVEHHIQVHEQMRHNVTELHTVMAVDKAE